VSVPKGNSNFKPTPGLPRARPVVVFYSKTKAGRVNSNSKSFVSAILPAILLYQIVPIYQNVYYKRNMIKYNNEY
jgi:hypothetical protein